MIRFGAAVAMGFFGVVMFHRLLLVVQGQKVKVIVAGASNEGKVGTVCGRDHFGNWKIAFKVRTRRFGRWWIDGALNGTVDSLPIVNERPKIQAQKQETELDDRQKKETLAKEELEKEKLEKEKLLVRRLPEVTNGLPVAVALFSVDFGNMISVW